MLLVQGYFDIWKPDGNNDYFPRKIGSPTRAEHMSQVAKVDQYADQFKACEALLYELESDDALSEIKVAKAISDLFQRCDLGHQNPYDPISERDLVNGKDPYANMEGPKFRSYKDMLRNCARSDRYVTYTTNGNTLFPKSQ